MPMVTQGISTLSPASTYPDLLLINNAGQGLNNTPSQVQDGLGNNTSMTISSNYINFNRSIAQFQIDGIPLTANINTLNNLSDVANARYILISPNGQLSNAATLSTTAGLSISQQSSQIIISPSSELAGIQQLFGGPTGLVVNLGGGNYTTCDLVSDATLQIVNPDGVFGNPTLSVIPDTSVQRINVELQGIFQSKKSQLNFIPGANCGITVFDNPSLNRTDITISTTPSAAFTYNGDVYASSTANLNATYNNGASGFGATLTNNGPNATFSLDGVNPPHDSLVLINNQTDETQNGIYVVTNIGSNTVAWVLTRAAVNYIQPASFVIVLNGDSYANTAWIEVLSPVNNIGADPIQFVQFAISGSVTNVIGTPGQIVVINGMTTPTISIDPTYIGQTSITTLGTISTGTWNADPIEVLYGGTGVSGFDPFAVVCGGSDLTAPLQTVEAGSIGQVLTYQGTDALPAWEDVSATSTFTITIDQDGHGLSVGDVIKCTGADTFAPAQADDAENAEVIGIVVDVIDADNFIFQFGGNLDILSGLTPADTYFLSPDIAGGYTNVAPSLAGQVSKPLFIAYNDIRALWAPERGQILGGP